MKTLFTLLFALCLSACAAAPRAPENPVPTGETAQTPPPESSVEITYVLGHSHRRFLAEAKSDQVLARTFMDHQILREGPVDAGHYREFLGKVGRFVAAPVRGPAQGGEAEDCRSPFKISVRSRGELKSTSGCRGNDDGTLGRLLREGEFLLSAKNNQ
jgi:hypothetical protein